MLIVGRAELILDIWREKFRALFPPRLLLGQYVAQFNESCNARAKQSSLDNFEDTPWNLRVLRESLGRSWKNVDEVRCSKLPRDYRETKR